MKRVSMLLFVLLIAVAFASSGFAQSKPAAPEKPKAAAEKAAPAPEKAAPAAPEKAAAAPEKAATEEKPAPPKPKPIPGFVGKVSAMNSALKIMTVAGKKDTVAFDIANAKFKGYKTMADVKVGDTVAAEYKKGSLLITKVKGAPAPKAAPAKKEKPAAKSFKDVDTNGDGKITIHELVIVFVNMTPEQFKALDKNGDGALDESEFNSIPKAKK